jgi:hypothetical protein
MWMVEPDTLVEELSRMGVMKLIEEGKPKQAAHLCYQRLLNDALPAERRQNNDIPNLYDMVSYLLDTAATLGFTLESKIYKDSVFNVITNNRLQENRTIPIMLELLLVEIFEKQSNVKSEVTQSGKETTVKIKLE